MEVIHLLKCCYLWTLYGREGYKTIQLQPGGILLRSLYIYIYDGLHDYGARAEMIIPTPLMKWYSTPLLKISFRSCGQGLWPPAAPITIHDAQFAHLHVDMSFNTLICRPNLCRNSFNFFVKNYIINTVYTINLLCVPWRTSKPFRTYWTLIVDHFFKFNILRSLTRLCGVDWSTWLFLCPHV